MKSLTSHMSHYSLVEMPIDLAITNTKRLNGMSIKLKKATCNKCLKLFIPKHHNIIHCSSKCYIKDNVFINPRTKCWNWTGAVGNRGYGKCTKDGESLRTHRFAYEVFVGEITDDKFVLHHCDNRLCLNPNHLFLGTHTDNVQDMHKKGRATTVGTKHHDNKLTEEQVYAIRKDARTTIEIGKEYGVSTATVSDIRLRNKWKHLPEETGKYEPRFGLSRLTKDQIIAIREDKRLQREIAADYGLQQAYVSKIKLGKLLSEVV